MSMLLRTLLFLPLAFNLFPADNGWTTPFPAHQVVGNVYYVGSAGLASYLITTDKGHILINSNLESSPALIAKSVEALGFKFSDVKILLISHAHWDHTAGSAAIKRLTNAKFMVMGPDVPVIEDGGQSDFQYGGDASTHYKAAHVDRVLKDGDQVKLGDTVLTAHLTAGHTRGCTTWTLEVLENGKAQQVVIVGSPNANEGYQLVKNTRYPAIAEDFKRTFATLKALPCDVFLGAHGDYYNLATKFPLLHNGGRNPFIDPAGYKAYVQNREQAFLNELKKQSALSQ